MSVDDSEEITRLTELLEGVSVDGPPLVTVSQWIGKRPKSVRANIKCAPVNK